GNWHFPAHHLGVSTAKRYNNQPAIACDPIQYISRASNHRERDFQKHPTSGLVRNRSYRQGAAD
ncbi:MAG TPA: hypothetical protein VF766_07965, partial [Pyrinomonadaceae bacterium]